VLAGPHGAARKIAGRRREIFLLDLGLPRRQIVLAAVPLGRERVLQRATRIDRRPGRGAGDVEDARLHRFIAPAFSATAFIAGSHSDSREAVKRVPIEIPAAPRAIAAARPRPSATPPAATTGIGATASTTAGDEPDRAADRAADRAGMAAGVTSLRDDDVGSGLGCLPRLSTSGSPDW
jgi:hypothetical protein